MTKGGERREISRETALKRNPGTRAQRRTILIVTNGERTEIDYFDSLKLEPWVTADRVRIRFKAGDPQSTVVSAASIQAESAYDEVWAVCDVDAYDVVPARRSAKTLSVGLALSQPCFEVWLILHRIDYAAYVEDARRAQRRLCELVPGWDKTQLNFADFRNGVQDAVRRARTLGEPPDANPSTGVWRLVEALGSPRDGSDGRQ